MTYHQLLSINTVVVIVNNRCLILIVYVHENSMYMYSNVPSSTYYNSGCHGNNIVHVQHNNTL